MLDAIVRRAGALLRPLGAVLLSALLSASLATSASADAGLTARGLAAFSGGKFAEALQEWQQAAAAGDGEAALYIGLMNDLGRGAGPDVQAARAWYERSAELGNRVAMFNLGVLHDAGIGVPADRSRAIAWYAQAATLGMGRAAYALGLIYKRGDGLPSDRAQAIRYFRQALAVGVTAAGPHLASLGAPAQSAGAAPRSKQETETSAFDRAQELLLLRTPEAMREAAKLLEQAAYKGDLLAAYNLAYCYDKGLGVPSDPRRAYVWYSRAARASTATIQRAARTGLEAASRRLSASELTEARAQVDAPRRGLDR